MSKALENEIFGEQPTPSDLVLKIEEMMTQYSCQKIDPKAKKHLKEIKGIKEKTIKIGVETRIEIEKLKEEVVIQKVKSFNLKSYNSERKNPAKKGCVSLLSKMKYAEMVKN
ncbi:MAG: hypothetical protein PHO80_05300 [Candidatus Gracilibacteria bacterium]|nr:hypothetical protein [Candidatus Gracilibacteria bacterium]